MGVRLKGFVSKNQLLLPFLATFLVFPVSTRPQIHSTDDTETAIPNRASWYLIRRTLHLPRARNIIDPQLCTVPKFRSA